MTLRIDPATPADVPVIFDLIKQLAVYEKLEHMVTGSEAMLSESLFGAKPVCECVVAREADVPVGFALYFSTFSTFLTKPGLYLEDLFVVPDKRGHGYGKALLQNLASIAQSRGCGRFEWRVLDWNEPSIKFYEAIGGEIMKEWWLVRMTEDRIATFANQSNANTDEHG
jgi:GNAT superfamily N-acetyltransferase